MWICLYADVGCRETERGTELTTVVLDGDVIGQQLMLASHTDEQRTSSPTGTRSDRGRHGTGRESMDELACKRKKFSVCNEGFTTFCAHF